MKYLVKISYDGSNFFGFQRLSGKRTVQEEIEKCLLIINKSSVSVKGAGRTDKGVHAYGQCLHFDLDVDVPRDRLINAMNSCLPKDIRVISCWEVSSDFHARFDVLRKKYVYKINLGEYDVLNANYYYQPEFKLDINKMKRVAKLFLGVHNFKNFVAGKRDNYEAIIYDIKFKKIGKFLEIEFVGKSFYRYMVRNLVGAMIDVGREKRNLVEVKEALDNYEIPKQFMTAPSCGLYLKDIEYKKENINLKKS